MRLAFDTVHDVLLSLGSALSKLERVFDNRPDLTSQVHLPVKRGVSSTPTWRLLLLLSSDAACR